MIKCVNYCCLLSVFVNKIVLAHGPLIPLRLAWTIFLSCVAEVRDRSKEHWPSRSHICWSLRKFPRGLHIFSPSSLRASLLNLPQVYLLTGLLQGSSSGAAAAQPLPITTKLPTEAEQSPCPRSHLGSTSLAANHRSTPPVTFLSVQRSSSRSTLGKA